VLNAPDAAEHKYEALADRDVDPPDVVSLSRLLESAPQVYLHEKPVTPVGTEVTSMI